ncbi:MAG TPA: YbaK/EbsC family protein [Iamia sp.]|nr:YbaK/EbsC family protein [Iamia sp.]
MTDTPFPRLDTAPALDRPDLLAPPVREAVQRLVDGGLVASDAVLSAPVDADESDTARSVVAYEIPPEQAANCVVVTGRRDGEERVAALVVLASTRADVNGVARRTLDVRRCTFMDRPEVAERTGMEYGGTGPLGVPEGWRVLVDRRVAEAGPVVIGSGIRASKVVVDGALFAGLPGVEVVDGLANDPPA